MWFVGMLFIIAGLWFASESQSFDLYDKAVTIILLFCGWALMTGSI